MRSRTERFWMTVDNNWKTTTAKYCWRWTRSGSTISLFLPFACIAPK